MILSPISQHYKTHKCRRIFQYVGAIAAGPRIRVLQPFLQIRRILSFLASALNVLSQPMNRIAGEGAQDTASEPAIISAEKIFS